MAENTMTTRDKNRADIMLGLFQTACSNFDRRRAYEWKLSFGIWTVLAILIGFALRGEVARTTAVRFPLCAGLYLMGIIQVFFQYRIKRGNDVDVARVHCYERQLNDLAVVDFREVEKAGAKVQTSWRMHGWWSLFFHLGITSLLIGGVVLALGTTGADGPLSGIFVVLSLVPSVIVGVGFLCCATLLPPPAAREAKFTAWIPWRDRRVIPGVAELPGVYLLAHFQSAPGGNDPAYPVTEHVVYVGETHDQNLNDRMDQFDASARDGRPGHSGGQTYRQKFGEPRANLYVAVQEVALENRLISSTYIRLLERFHVYNYTRRWSQLPACNKE